MIESSVKDAFNFPSDISVEKLSTGLINHTYKISLHDGTAYLLQSINTNVFAKPIVLQQNYLKIGQHFAREGSYILPAILPAADGKLLFEQDSEVWRCFQFIKDTYSPTVSSTPDEAWLVANCFGNFSAKLSSLDAHTIEPVLPGFHDLSLRFEQYESALAKADKERQHAAASLIKQAGLHYDLVAFFARIQKDTTRFPLHILHHDCKIANILFKKEDQKIYSPIDLDTTQPGLFFSDLGDMIRSMTPNFPEDYKNAGELTLRDDFYEAVRDGYLSAMYSYLSKEELDNIDLSGNIIIYMQALRFLTDYLNNDIYYQIKYPDQNLDRAANQFQLLTLLIKYTSGRKKTATKYY